MLYIENVSGGGGGKLRFQEIRGGEPGIQLFSVIYTMLIDIRGLMNSQRGVRKSKGGECPPPWHATQIT